MKLAFIGLGVMGFPMAGHLQRAGHEVCVYNRSPARARQWCETYGGVSAPTPCDAARGAAIAFMCVGDDNDVREVAVGTGGALAGLAPGTLLVDHTTVSAELARELADAAATCSVGFLDAPVSGGQAGAENGALTIMVGGGEESFAAASPLLNCYARSVRHMGPAGSGQLTKMVNQICIAGVLEGLAEGLAFSEKAGLDSRAVIEVIAAGAAQSWQMENRYKTMLRGEYEHGFAVDWMRKDLAIVLEQARELWLELPVTELVDRYYAEVQAMGGGRWDTSSLFTRYQPPSGTPD